MGCEVPLADACALPVSVIERRVLLHVLLQCNEYHAGLDVSGCYVESRWL